MPISKQTSKQARHNYALFDVIINSTIKIKGALRPFERTQCAFYFLNFYINRSRHNTMALTDGQNFY